jgi:hypothetical protein
MGYTHYWKFNPTEKTEKQFKNVLKDCQLILANKGNIVICGGDGEGEPEITKDVIWLNGDRKNENNYETFYFSPFEQTEFDFCKTAKKPYDLIVGAILLSLAHRLTGFSFSSDGDFEKENEWKPIFKYYEKIGLKFRKGEKQKIIGWL